MSDAQTSVPVVSEAISEERLRELRADLVCIAKTYPDPYGDVLKVIDELLSRRAADARPCTCHPDDNPPSPCPRKYALSECRRAADALDSEADGWVPVGERLPDHGSAVIVYCAERRNTYTALYRGEKWWPFCPSSGYSFGEEVVTHWRERPPPPPTTTTAEDGEGK